MTHLYYNPASATGDSRAGLGYGKSQRIPSFGTGTGSETSMGSSETGIYTEPPREFDDDEDDYEFDFDEPDMDRFVNMINRKAQRTDRTFWPRADRSSLGSSSIGWALSIGESSIPIQKGGPLPKASNTIAPFSHRTLYPSGFSGPPLGSGGSAQAFRTTGAYKRTGTQYGTSRAPLRTDDDTDHNDYEFLSILDTDPSERSMIKQRLKILKLLNRIDEIDKESESLSYAE